MIALLFFLAIRLFIGALFLYSGAQKLRDIQAFRQAIATFQLLPTWGVGLLARILPGIECLLGIALLTGIFTLPAEILLLVLLLLFSGALLSAWIRKKAISCGCFGRSEQRTRVLPALLRNLLLILLLASLLSPPGRVNTSPLFFPFKKVYLLAFAIAAVLLFCWFAVQIAYNLLREIRTTLPE
jgi:putative oxidoreductase